MISANSEFLLMVTSMLHLYSIARLFCPRTQLPTEPNISSFFILHLHTPTPDQVATQITSNCTSNSRLYFFLSLISHLPISCFTFDTRQVSTF
ncbi:hypothetical protein FPQ18DRAFT_316856 [Pyronema domesticum]|nr:hypothetical protein FPQ18DRAFT_316856 [Pyronema domesticum]